MSLFGTSGPPPRPPARDRVQRRRVLARRRLAALATGVIGVIVVIVLLTLGGGGVPAPPAAGVAVEAHSTDPFSYATSKADDFTARATAGNAHVLFTKSPGGALATAERVAAFRPMIDQAVKGTDIDPRLLEGLVFVESAGRPDVIAGNDPAGASGLTQILAETGTSLLGMHIDLARSRALTKKIDAVAAGATQGNLQHLEAERAAADQRFSPRQALAATVRYLQDAEHQFHREDLAFESYHMGIGNLTTVLDDYDGGAQVPYAQLYFDVGPQRHTKAFRLLASFGDDSSLYWWRILGAVEIMHLYRTDRSALRKLASEQLTDDAGATVLHPLGRPPRFGDPSALSKAYQDKAIVPLPSNGRALGLAYAGRMGAGATQLKVPRALYRGLRPVALKLLIELAGRIRSLSGAAPLRVGSTVSDVEYQKRQGLYAPLAASGWSFDIDRHYKTGAQAQAFQELLDRLQSLNLIAWAANGSEIEITVASDASSWRG